MKIRTAVAALALLCALPPTLAAQDAFEGVFRQRMIVVPLSVLAPLVGGESPDAERVFALPFERLLELPRGVPPAGAQLVEMQIYTKGAKRRIEMSMPGLPMPAGMYSIHDQDARMMHSVMPEAGMVLSIPLDEQGVADALAAAAATGAQMEADAQVTRIDRRTIQGYETVGFEARGSSIHVRTWVAPALRGFTPINIPGVPTVPTGPLGDISSEGFPLLMKMLLLEATPATPAMGPASAIPPSYMINEVLSIERRTLDASLFEIPPALRRISPGG